MGWSLQILGVLAGGVRLESPLKTVDFLEAYPEILGQRFSCPSINSCLDSSGEHTVSLFPSLGHVVIPGGMCSVGVGCGSWIHPAPLWA